MTRFPSIATLGFVAGVLAVSTSAAAVDSTPRGARATPDGESTDATPARSLRLGLADARSPYRGLAATDALPPRVTTSWDVAYPSRPPLFERRGSVSAGIALPVHGGDAQALNSISSVLEFRYGSHAAVCQFADELVEHESLYTIQTDILAYRHYFPASSPHDELFVEAGGWSMCKRDDLSGATVGETYRFCFLGFGARHVWRLGDSAAVYSAFSMRSAAGPDIDFPGATPDHEVHVVGSYLQANITVLGVTF